MKLLEMINDCQIYIPPENYILIEYELFFNNDLGKYNRFSIDDNEEIEMLKHIIGKMQSVCKVIELYICAYSYETVDYKGEKSVYADCIWINTDLDTNFIRGLFDDYITIQPSDIIRLEEMEEYNQDHLYLFKNDGNVINIKKDYPESQLDNVIILYWD